MARINLTERRIAALQPDPAGKRRPELRDSQVPGLIVRMAAKRRVYAVHCRFPGVKHPTRRVIGEVGALTLDTARDVARQWLDLIRKGIDPAAEARRREDDERRACEAARVQDECRFERRGRGLPQAQGRWSTPGARGRANYPQRANPRLGG